MLTPRRQQRILIFTFAAAYRQTIKTYGHQLSFIKLHRIIKK